MYAPTWRARVRRLAQRTPLRPDREFLTPDSHPSGLPRCTSSLRLPDRSERTSEKISPGRSWRGRSWRMQQSRRPLCHQSSHFAHNGNIPELQCVPKLAMRQLNHPFKSCRSSGMGGTSCTLGGIPSVIHTPGSAVFGGFFCNASRSWISWSILLCNSVTDGPSGCASDSACYWTRRASPSLNSASKISFCSWALAITASVRTWRFLALSRKPLHASTLSSTGRTLDFVRAL